MSVILSQVVAGAISIAFTNIPEYIISTWLGQSIAPVFAIMAVVKLGIPHPPAAAHSVVYASGHYGWMFYMLVILGSIVSIIPATLINNLSSKRQYPTYIGDMHRGGYCSVHDIYMILPLYLRKAHLSAYRQRLCVLCSACNIINKLVLCIFLIFLLSTSVLL